MCAFFLFFFVFVSFLFFFRLVVWALWVLVRVIGVCEKKEKEKNISSNHGILRGMCRHGVDTWVNKFFFLNMISTTIRVFVCVFVCESMYVVALSRGHRCRTVLCCRMSSLACFLEEQGVGILLVFLIAHLHAFTLRGFRGGGGGGGALHLGCAFVGWGREVVDGGRWGLDSRGAGSSTTGARMRGGQGGRVGALVGLAFLLRWSFVVACRSRWPLGFVDPMVDLVFKGGRRLAVVSGLELDRPWVDLTDGPLHVNDRLSVGAVRDVYGASVGSFFDGLFN